MSKVPLDFLGKAYGTWKSIRVYHVEILVFLGLAIRYFVANSKAGKSLDSTAKDALMFGYDDQIGLIADSDDFDMDECKVFMAMVQGDPRPVLQSHSKPTARSRGGEKKKRKKKPAN